MARTNTNKIGRMLKMLHGLLTLVLTMALAVTVATDPGFTDRMSIVADCRDGKPPAENAAPFQIVVPGEKKHGRWIRQLVALTVKETR